MKVVIVSGKNKGYGIQYHLKIVDSYRAGQLVRVGVEEYPLFDTDQDRLVKWTLDTGYEVVKHVVDTD